MITVGAGVIFVAGMITGVILTIAGICVCAVCLSKKKQAKPSGGC